MWVIASTVALGLAFQSPLGSPAASVAVAAPPPPVVPFEDWAEANGINAPKVAVTGTEDLRGVVLLEDVVLGEELACVPRTTCLDLSAVEGSGSPCEALVPSPLWTTLRWYERLACWLLAEQRRGAASPVVGYLGYLPRPETFADVPLEWTDDELTALSYPPVAASIREQGAEIDALYRALVGGQGGPLAATVSLGELRWALQLVLSRAFTSTIATPEMLAARNPPPPPPPDALRMTAQTFFGKVPILGNIVNGPPPPPPPSALGDGLEMAMMPMLDAFNHNSNAKVSCAYDGTRNAFVLTANAALGRGEQACISYGDKSNDELLQLFGFVEEENPHDVFLSIGLDSFLAAPSSGFFPSEQAAQARFAKLRALDLEQFLLGELTATEVPQPTMHALRVLLGTVDEVDGEGAKLLGTPKSLATELRVWAALMGYCKMARSAMGGPRSADLQAARGARRAGDARRAMALTFRAEKKRLLSELENRLGRKAARSKKAGKVRS